MHKKIIVMQLQNDPANDDSVLNPYVKLLTDSLPQDRVRTRWFRWKGVLTDSFDVLHVHWPEFYVRHHTFAGRLLKAAIFTTFLARVQLTRKPVVRTVHNLRPHESGGMLERRLLAWLDSMTNKWIIMNESTPSPDPSRTVLIPHGHYRGWYKVPENIHPVGGSLLTFGRVRAYKGIDELIAAFLTIDDDLNLTVLGKSDGPETEQVLSNMSANHPRISLDFRFVPDDELATAITKCQLVVLPYRDILNSGSALLALSLNRPVLMRDTPSTRLLRDEFGSDWIILFEGELTSSTIIDAVSNTARGKVARKVDMSLREWNVIGEKLADTYESAIRDRASAET